MPWDSIGFDRARAGQEGGNFKPDLVAGMRPCDVDSRVFSIVDKPGFKCGGCKLPWFFNEDKTFVDEADRGKLLFLAQRATNFQLDVVEDKAEVLSSIKLPLVFTCEFQEGKFRLGFFCWTNEPNVDDQAKVYFQTRPLDPWQNSEELER